MNYVHNNYHEFGYNNDPTRKTRNNELYARWGIKFNSTPSIGKGVGSLKHEMNEALQLVYETLRTLTPTLNLFFSGGSDSEVVLRALTRLRIPVRPIHMVHTHQPKSIETSYARKICGELGLKPLVIPVNLSELHRTEKLYHIYQKYDCPLLAMMEIGYGLEQLGEPAIVVDELSMRKLNLDQFDLDAKPEWYYEFKDESTGFLERYSSISGIPVITGIFRYTPGLWYALISSGHVRQMIEDPGKLSAASTKNQLLSYQFGIQHRKKTYLTHNPSIHRIATHAVYSGKSHLQNARCYVPYYQLKSTLESYL